MNLSDFRLLALSGVFAAAGAQASIIEWSVNSVDPYAAEAALLAKMPAYVTEDFSGYALGEAASPFTSKVGDWSATGAQGVGFCQLVGSGDCTDLAVLNDATSPYGGRYDVTDGDGDTGGAGQWLDSNDVSAISWDIDDTDGALAGALMVNAFGFYIMDPSDVGANLIIDFIDGSSQILAVISSELNGSLHYVSVLADTTIIGATVEFTNFGAQTTNDGFGIDDVTIGYGVPEPMTVGLLGLAFAGLGIGGARRAR